jgi:hypothetical protein
MKQEGSSDEPSIKIDFPQHAFRPSAFVRRGIRCSDCPTKVKGIRETFDYAFEFFSLRWVRGIRLVGEEDPPQRGTPHMRQTPVSRVVE